MTHPPEEAAAFAAFGDTYALLDHGDGQRLEYFGGITVQRPSPASTHAPAHPLAGWSPSLHWEATTKQWHGDAPEDWSLHWGPHTLSLRPAGAGQVGLFPEQAPNWRWIRNLVTHAERPLRILNGFAYTGGATLAASTPQTEVVHLDGAKPAVRWARQNAEASSMQSHTIRWIVEDVMTFLAREIRRGNRYDGLILDPPAFGRGQNRKPWKLTQDLPRLLDAASQLLSPNPAFLLLSCHPTGWTEADLAAAVQQSSLPGGGRMETLTLRIPCAAATPPLDAGFACRIHW